MGGKSQPLLLFVVGPKISLCMARLNNNLPWMLQTVWL